ncbi:non-homologous end-joining DNA ligase [Limibaculum sp. M0105]|uniref:DNA ligase (ATP) n=1 Tax=Thermohalobaculum xanthum TaxID=2753746 RepID=A0A8J7M9R7_9RHOB|nr:non-homologous end-joining DNA ligase [Thermohalobaculum xanthum]MBK0401329.1 non-homologous end-joining DNA ligase [Thermohalobaculum xanthum]
MSAPEILADILDTSEREDLPKEDLPEWRDPALATLTDARFSDPDWLFERKLDGERALAYVMGDGVRLLSRNRKSLSESYPELVEALEERVRCDALIDGEIVAFKGSISSFSRLQGRMQIKDPDEARVSGIAIYYYLFDILHADGRDLTALPLRRRKRILKRAVDYGDPIRYTPHRNEAGEAFIEEACEKGWEGLIAKRAGDPHHPGRSRAWLKFKCAKGQELVIGGYTAPEGERAHFGALLLGYYEGESFRYAGKVGTGFDDQTLADLHDRMSRFERETPPFDDPPPEDGITWVSPELVAEIGFTEWTDAGKLRHPRYLGLRRDKAAEDVVREEAS